MMTGKKIFFVIGLLGMVFWGIYFWYSKSNQAIMSPESALSEEVVIPPDPLVERVTVSGELESVSTSASTIKPVAPKSWEDVFFTSQAPTGEWAKSEFQNGCEEASALMVHAWRSGRSYTKDEVKAELIALARYQEKQIGQAVDTDVTDTADILLNGYFYISDYRVIYDFTLEELKQALSEGVVIVPTNGQALSNPNFTRPGPAQHMLVVTGYDAEKKAFITNDPGTWKGAGFHYPEAVLYGAIREYPTGKHLSIAGERKAMIIIPPQSATP